MEAATIHVYDVTKVLGISKKLAEKYIIDSDNLTGKINTFSQQMFALILHFSIL